MPNVSTPLLGWAFNDVLNELHQLVFEGVPGESHPFVLHLDGRKLSEMEWQRWLKTWSDFAKRIDARHAGLASYIAYAVGIARDDKNLMNQAFDTISASIEDNDRLKGTIRDIDSVVVFMKAATSKNRSDGIIIGHLQSRGIEDF
ncbi:MAG: hypothetical protein P8X48_12135 [Acidiferrobacteraceae bacterium]